MLIFRPLFDPSSSTWTYLLGDHASGEAVLIDPVFEQLRRDETLIRELGLTLKWTLETHVHADHVTAAWLLRQRLGSRIALSADSGARGADRLVRAGETVAFGSRHLQVRATPGHTNGCLSYVLDDESRVFTGDCLLIRGCGRTDFQQGSTASLYRSVHMQLFTLPVDCLVYPGHDYNGMGVSSIGEERRFNPRLGGDVAETDFAGFMQHLGLPHPKKMDLAVPANLRCGRPEGDIELPADPTWAHLNFSIAGLWEITPHALADVAARVQVVDVRERRNSATDWDTSKARCWCRWASWRAGWPSCRATSRSSPCAAPARARPAPRRCSARPVSPRWPTCAAACCAGAPTAGRWWGRVSSQKSSFGRAIGRIIS